MLTVLLGTTFDALRSTFTEPEGWLAAFAIRSTFWLLLVALGARLARTAAGRHGAWTAGLVGLIALPLASAWTPAWTLPVLPTAPVMGAAQTVEAIVPRHTATPVAVGNASPSSTVHGSLATAMQDGLASREGTEVVGSILGHSTPSTVLTGDVPRSTSSVGFSLSRALFVLWAVGFALLVVRLGRDAVIRAQLVAKAEPLVDPSWLEDVEQAAQTIGAGRRPRLFVSSEVPVPLTWGLCRSVLVVPIAALTWTEARRRSVLLHELAHIRRHDATWFLAGQVASAMAWFQPLAWWAVRRQRAESELTCDDRVVTGGVRASTYANELVTIARQARCGLPVAAASFARHSGVGERVRAILDVGRDRSAPSRWQAVLGVVLASGLVLPALAAVVPGPRAEGWPGSAASDGLDPAPASDSEPAPAPVPTPLAPSRAIAAPSPAPSSVPSPAPLADSPPRQAPRSPHASRVPTTPAAPRVSGVPAVAPAPHVPSGPSSAPAVVPAPTAPSAPGVPSVPGAPGIPGVPPVPMMSDLLQGCGDANSTKISNDNGDLDITIKAGRCRFTLHVAGEVEFLDDESGIARMGRGAEFSVEEHRPGVRRELEVTPGPNGTPRFVWRVDRAERPFDDGARAWLAELIPTVFRATGMQAEERTARLIERGGADAVFDEIAVLRGDYVRRLYYSALIESTALTDAQALRWIRSAGDTIASDYELGSVLRLLPADHLEREDVQVAMVEAGRTIDSDYELRQMLTPLLVRDEVHPAALGVVVELAGEVQSDYELATLLVDLVERHRALQHPELRDTFVAVARTIDSDYELKRTLVAALGTRLDPDIQAAILDTAATIDSDYELASVLVEAARRQQLAGPGRDAWERALATVGSDHERERARRAVR